MVTLGGRERDIVGMKEEVSFIKFLFLFLYCKHNYIINNYKQFIGVAAIVQWLCLRLPSCRPGFESHAQHLCFFPSNFNFNVKKDKLCKNGPGLATF